MRTGCSVLIRAAKCKLKLNNYFNNIKFQCYWVPKAQTIIFLFALMCIFFCDARYPCFTFLRGKQKSGLKPKHDHLILRCRPALIVYQYIGLFFNRIVWNYFIFPTAYVHIKYFYIDIFLLLFFFFFFNFKLSVCCLKILSILIPLSKW